MGSTLELAVYSYQLVVSVSTCSLPPRVLADIWKQGVQIEVS